MMAAVQSGQVADTLMAGAGLDVARAALIMDLMQAGVTSELSEYPFDWWATAPVRVAAPSAVAADAAAMAIPQVARALVETSAARETSPEAVAAFAAAAQALSQDMARKAALGMAQDAPVKAIAARAKTARLVWQAGEPDGVVVVVRGVPSQAGTVPYQGKMLQLLQAMLQAVGLQQEPLGWAVLGCEEETIQVEQQGDLQQAVLQLQPKHVLVLGQVVVGTLAKQTLGVEGWQVAPKPLLPEDSGFVGRIGVTYPPELLLARPVFKRLAWQHLQKWRFA